MKLFPTASARTSNEWPTSSQLNLYSSRLISIRGIGNIAYEEPALNSNDFIAPNGKCNLGLKVENRIFHLAVMQQK